MHTHAFKSKANVDGVNYKLLAYRNDRSWLTRLYYDDGKRFFRKNMVGNLIFKLSL